MKMECCNCGKLINEDTSTVWSNYGNPLRYCGDCVPSLDDFEDKKIDLETGKLKNELKKA